MVGMEYPFLGLTSQEGHPSWVRKDPSKTVLPNTKLAFALNSKEIT